MKYGIYLNGKVTKQTARQVGKQINRILMTPAGDAVKIAALQSLQEMIGCRNSIINTNIKDESGKREVKV